VSSIIGLNIRGNGCSIITREAQFCSGRYFSLIILKDRKKKYRNSHNIFGVRQETFK